MGKAVGSSVWFRRTGGANMHLHHADHLSASPLSLLVGNSDPPVQKLTQQLCPHLAMLLPVFRIVVAQEKKFHQVYITLISTLALLLWSMDEHNKCQSTQHGVGQSYA